MLTYKNPKAKSCVVCERVFVPQSMSQIVCRQSCALKKARDEAGDKIRPYTLLCARQALGLEGRQSWQ